MKTHVNYEERKIEFNIPKGWNVISGEDRPPVAGVREALEEVRRALDNPVGSPGIEQLARPGMEVVIIFDDLQRPTPAHIVLPEIMDRLNRAGVTDERIKGVCGLGTHPLLDLATLKTKVGETAFSRLEGRIFCHDPHASDNVIIGRTHRGSLVEINPHVAAADLIVGVGECMPHPVAGYGGGFKLIMPGVCSYRSVADHHFTWMRHRNSRVNVLDGNFFWEEIVDAGRISKMAFKVDLIMNERECMPHPIAGFGGGCKIIMPGVCSYRSVADHHFTWMRHRDSKVNLMDGNHFYEDIVDAGRISKMAFKVDLIMNEKKEIIRAFAGDPEAEQRAAAGYAESLYRMPLSGLADVTIISAYPMEVGVQSTKALVMGGFCTRSGGTIIWVAPQKEAGPIMPLIKEMGSPESASDFHRRLIEGNVPEHLKQFGISYIMQIVYFKELAEKFNVVHVTEGLTREQVETMKYGYASDLQEAIDRVAEEMPRADVAVFPSGGNIIPEVSP